MAGQGWQVLIVFLSIFFLGIVLFLGFRLFLRVSRREQADLDRDQAALAERARQEVLADLEIARRAEAAASAPPGSSPSSPDLGDGAHADR